MVDALPINQGHLGNPAVFKFPREFSEIFDFQLCLIFGMYNLTL